MACRWSISLTGISRHTSSTSCSRSICGAVQPNPTLCHPAIGIWQCSSTELPRPEAFSLPFRRLGSPWFPILPGTVEGGRYHRRLCPGLHLYDGCFRSAGMGAAHGSENRESLITSIRMAALHAPHVEVPFAPGTFRTYCRAHLLAGSSIGVSLISKSQLVRRGFTNSCDPALSSVSAPLFHFLGPTPRGGRL